MTCSSLNLDRFIVRLLRRDGLYLGAEGNQGLRSRSSASFQETTTAHSNTLRLIADLREKQRQDRRWLPWVGLGGVVLALVLTVTLPRFLASNPTTCALIGATWTATSTGVNACVFYGE